MTVVAAFAATRNALPRAVIRSSPHPPCTFLSYKRETRLFQQQQQSPLELFQNETSSIQEETEYVADLISEEAPIDGFLETNKTEQNSSEKTSSTVSDLWDMPAESIAWLNAVAIVWGTQHAVIKLVVQDSDASAFSLARFALAALLASPHTPGLFRTQQQDSTISDTTATAWRWGAEMGMWMFLGYAFQAVGLAFTTAQRSGFLLYLNVKFVPFLGRLFFGKEISIPTWLSAATALVGTGLLLVGNGSDASSLEGGLNVGDAWSVAAAAASAMFILRLESASKAVPASAQLNAACLWVVTGLALVWSITQNGLDGTLDNVVDTITTHPWALVYLGGVTTALANYMQTKAQKGVSAERASVIYAMDPVYGAVFSNLLLGEELQGWGIVGAGLITVAAATNAFLDFGTTTKESEKVQ